MAEWGDEMYKILTKLVLAALIFSGVPAMAQTDLTTGFMPKEAILSQSVGGARLQLGMDYERIVYQLEQTGYQLAFDADPRLVNFIAQRPNYCELGGRGPGTVTLSYIRRQDGGHTSYALTWVPGPEGHYVMSSIQYRLRTERVFGRAHFYEFIPGMERGQSLEPYCGTTHPRTCNVFSVPEGVPENLRYMDTRIYMNHHDDLVLAERADLPELNRVCDR